MKKYIHNEWLKLRYNRIIFVFAGIGLAFCIFAAAVVPLQELTVYDYAWMASTEFLKNVGVIVSFLMVGIAAGIFSMDFKQHTVQNALSCGVSRNEIFLSKICVYYSFGFLVHLISLLLYTVLVGLIVGWASPHFLYPHLAATMLVFHLGEAVIVFFYMSCFLFLGMIFRNPGAHVFMGFVVFYADLWIASLTNGIGHFRPTGARCIWWILCGIICVTSLSCPGSSSSFFCPVCSQDACYCSWPV